MYRSCTPAESHWYRHMVTRVFVPDHASRQRRTGQRGGPGVTTPSVDYCLAKVTFGFWPTLHVALTGEVDMAPTICVVPLNVPLKTRVHCAAATCGDKVIATVDPVTVPDNWPPLMLLFGTPIVTLGDATIERNLRKGVRDRRRTPGMPLARRPRALRDTGARP